MAKSKLNDHQKARVLELHDSGKCTQRQIAEFFNVSPRTIHRVLEEAGRIKTRRLLTDQEKDILALVQASGLSVDEAKECLTRPALTPGNVVQVVASMDDQELGAFLMNCSRIRLVQELRERESAKAQARASNGEMQQEKLYG